MRFGGVQLQTEEHAAGIGILKGTAVSVEPGGKDHTIGAGGYFRCCLGESGECISLRGNGTVVIAQFILCQVGFCPIQTFTCGLHFRKVIEFIALGAYDGGNHGGHIHHLLIGYGNYPTGGAPIDMGIAGIYTTGTHTDQAGITAATEYTGAFFQAQLCGGFLGQTTHTVCGCHDLRQVLHIDTQHVTDGFAPSAMTLSGVIKKRRKSAVLGYGKATGAAGNQVILYIQPAIRPLEILRFMGFYPLVFPNGIFDAAGYGASDHKTLD